MSNNPKPITGTIHYDPAFDWRAIFGPEERTSMVFYDYSDHPLCFLNGVMFKNLQTKQVPDGPWQRFKERWLPRWFRWLIPWFRVRYAWHFSADCVAESVTMPEDDNASPTLPT